MTQRERVRSAWWLRAAGTTLLIFLLVLSGCRPLLSTGNGDGTGDSGDDGSSTPVIGTTARSVIDNLENDLDVETSLTAAERQTIIESVEASIVAADLGNSTNVSALLTTTVSSAQRSLGTQNPTYADRSDVVGAIVGSAVGSINVGATSASVFSRALSTADKAAILKSISGTSVANMGGAGLTSTEIPGTTGKAVQSMVTRLGQGTRTANLDKTELHDALTGITQGAVESLGSARGKTDTSDEIVPNDQVRQAVNAISRAATGSLARVQVTGVTAEDVTALARQVSQTAATSVKEVAMARIASGDLSSGDAAGEIENTIREVSRGATAAINDIRNTGRLDIATTIDTGTLVQQIAAGAGLAARSVADELYSIGVTVDITLVVQIVVRGSAEQIQRDFGTQADVATILASAVSGAALAAKTMEDDSGDGNLVDDSTLGESLRTALTTGVKTALIEEGYDETTADSTATNTTSTIDTATAVTDGFTAAQNLPPVIESLTILTPYGSTSAGTFYPGTAITIRAVVSDPNVDGSTGAPGLTTLQPSWIWYETPANLPPLTFGTPVDDTTSYTRTFTATFTPWTVGDFDIIFRVLDGVAYREERLSATAPITVVDEPITSDEARERFVEAVKYLTGETTGTPDPDQAMNIFSFILSKTPDSPYLPAVVGYDLLNIANVAVDPDVRAFATGTLGLMGYPDAFNEVINPSSWLESVTVGDYPTLLPRVSGQTDRNGDGVVDFQERMYALVDNLFTNVNLNDTVDLFGGALGVRLDSAIARITALSEYDAANGANGTSFGITWSMVFGTWPDAVLAGWPFTGTGSASTDAAVITIGAPELKLLLSQLEFIRGMTYMAKLIDLGIDLSVYWDGFDPATGEFAWPDVSVLANGFLDPRVDSATNLAAASTHFLSAAALAKDALDTIQLRTGNDPFFLSPSMPTYSSYSSYDGATSHIGWDVVSDGVSFASIFLGRISGSILSSAPLVMPTDFMAFAGPKEYTAHYAEPTNWPDLSDVGQNVVRDYNTWDDTTHTYPDAPRAVAINLGRFFAGPVYGVGDILTLTTTDEPAFYTVSVDTSSPLSLSFDQATSFTTGTGYYIRIRDISFGGTIPLENLPGGSVSDFNGLMAEYDETGAFDDTPAYLVDNGDGSLSLYVNVDDYSVGNSLVPEGRTFLTEWGRIVTSLGSFWRIPIYELRNILPDPGGITVHWINVYPTIPSAGTDTVNMEVSAYHTDNIELRYTWGFEQKPIESTATIAADAYYPDSASFTPDVAGEYVVSVTIFGGDQTLVKRFTVQAFGSGSGGAGVEIQ